MPQEAARIFLRVTGVRVERLQKITYDEAIREGADRGRALNNFEWIWNHTIKPADLSAYGWDANPWVWVFDFERISKEKGPDIMNLEEATKEELVWWIREHSFELHQAMKHFSSDIMLHRSQQYNEKAKLAGERYSKASAEYSELLSPYMGRKISEIPRDVCKKGAELEQVMLQAAKEQRRCWRAADNCIKRTLG